MKALKLFLCFLVCGLTACAPPPYQHLSDQVDQDQARLENQFQKKPEVHSATAPLVLDELQPSAQAAWLKTKINIHAKMSLADVAHRITEGLAVNNIFDPDVNQSMPVTINYSGTKEGALNLLTEQTGYAYTIDNSAILWSSFITRTFDVSFMPGASKYLVGNKDNGGGAGSGSAGSSGAGAASSAPVDIDTGGQYSDIEGDLSLWQDLQNTIKGMLSEKGKANVSQATTTVTVTDKPQNVRMIQNYLANMNQTLSREVALDVQVIEITLDKSFNYGIDWHLVRTAVAGRYNLMLANSSSSQVDPSGIAPETLLLKSSGGVWGGTNTFINALAQQGKVSIATQPRVVTLNNQVAEIGINTQTTYLAQVSTTNTIQVGTTTALTPGQVTTGFTLYLLPKVQGNNIYLQISSTLSSLVSLETFTSGSGSSQNSIKGPIVTQKRFNQRSLVPSSATLVIAGFKQLTNKANNSSLFGVDQLGGYGGSQDNVETIILITPSIINLKEQ